MEFDCWAVFVGDSEEPVYISDDDELQSFASKCLSDGAPVEIIAVFVQKDEVML